MKSETMFKIALIVGIPVCFLIGYMCGFGGWLCPIDTDIVEEKTDTGYKFVLSINNSDLTEEQFTNLSYQWIHYLLSGNWSIPGYSGELVIEFNPPVKLKGVGKYGRNI